MNYEIYTYGNVDALWGLFNALAALMGSSTFTAAIAVVFFVGFFGAFLGSALAPDRLVGPKWLASVMVIYLILFVPKATLQIVDKVGGTAPAVIANVPLGLAFQAGITSSVGNALTELFETALQTLPAANGLPSDLTYQNHGLVFGAQIVKATQESGFTDMVFKTNLVNFLQNCTFYDISQGFIAANVFATTDDIWPLLATTNMARYSPYKQASGVIDPLACPAVYNALSAAMTATAVPTLMQRIGLWLNPSLQLANPTGATLPGTAAATLVDQQIGAAFQRFRIASAATSAATIVRQTAMINAIQAANLLSSQDANDPSAAMIGLATAQATAQTNTQQIASAQIASQGMPMVRNAIEAVLYGLFPFILLMALLMGGVPGYQMLKMYGMGLVWIALWPPIYAIVNYLNTLAIAKNAAANAFNAATGVQGMTLSTSGAIYGGMISDMAVTGYLVMAVPMIAGAVAFGMNKMVNVAGGFGTAATSATGTGAGAAATGNVSMGNISNDQQQLSPNRSSAFMSTYSDLKGSTATDAVSGDVRFQQNVGSNAMRLGSTSENSTRFGEASSKSHAFGQEQARAADAATTSALQTALDNTRSHGTGTQGTAGYGAQHGAGSGSDVAKLASIRTQLAKDLGITDSSRATSVLALSLGIGNDEKHSNSITDKDAYATKAVSKFVRADFGATGTQVTDNQLSAAVKRARNSATGMDVKDVDKVMDNYTESKDFKDLAASNRSEADKISASMSQAKSLRTSASNAFRQSDDYRQTAENLKSAALRGEIDWTPEFNRFLKDRGTLGVTGDEAVAEANAFFKQTGVGVGADGTPKAVLYGKQGGPSAVTVTPGSYRDPQRLQHTAQEASLMVNGQSATASGMDQLNRANRQTVTARGTGTPTAPTDDRTLKEQYDGERQHAQTRVNAGRTDAQKEQKALGNDYLTALDGSSPAHVLGNQGNGMSGAQQVKTGAKSLQKEQRTSEGIIRQPTKK
jgi:conjugal transfer mating pair stabilization protein TraG